MPKSVTEKATIVTEAYGSPRNVKATARKYGIQPQHIRRWSRQLHRKFGDTQTLPFPIPGSKPPCSPPDSSLSSYPSPAHGITDLAPVQKRSPSLESLECLPKVHPQIPRLVFSQHSPPRPSVASSVHVQPNSRTWCPSSWSEANVRVAACGPHFAPSAHVAPSAHTAHPAHVAPPAHSAHSIPPAHPTHAGPLTPSPPPINTNPTMHASQAQHAISETPLVSAPGTAPLQAPHAPLHTASNHPHGSVSAMVHRPYNYIWPAQPQRASAYSAGIPSSQRSVSPQPTYHYRPRTAYGDVSSPPEAASIQYPFFSASSESPRNESIRTSASHPAAFAAQPPLDSFSYQNVYTSSPHARGYPFAHEQTFAREWPYDRERCHPGLPPPTIKSEQNLASSLDSLSSVPSDTMPSSSLSIASTDPFMMMPKPFAVPTPRNSAFSQTVPATIALASAAIAATAHNPSTLPYLTHADQLQHNRQLPPFSSFPRTMARSPSLLTQT